MLELAERYYHSAGLAGRILSNAPRRNMRPNAAELAALLQVGELDYVIDYESVALAYGFPYLRLPAAIDLGDPARTAEYAAVSVRVPGMPTAENSAPDSVTFTGRPIVYALTIPVAAPHPPAGERLATFLLSAEGRRMMRAAHVDALEHAMFVGASVPATLRDAANR
jgi:molybdate/tungstate transport system substrate-binding protein